MVARHGHPWAIDGPTPGPPNLAFREGASIGFRRIGIERARGNGFFGVGF